MSVDTKSDPAAAAEITAGSDGGDIGSAAAAAGGGAGGGGGSTSGGVGGQAVSIEAAAEYWRSVGLDGRRSDIDSQALAMSDNDEKSQAVRKQLAAVTKSMPLTSHPLLSSQQIAALNGLTDSLLT